MKSRPVAALTTALARTRSPLPLVGFVAVTAAVATSLFSLNAYANQRHDAALALVQLEAGVAQEDALAIEVSSPAATFATGVDLTLQEVRVRAALAALGSRHVDAASVASIRAAYGGYATARAAEAALFSRESASAAMIDGERLVVPPRQALNSLLAATAQGWAAAGGSAGDLAGRLSSGLVVAVAVVTAMALRRLWRRRRAVAARSAEERVVRESERSFRALFDGNPQPMFAWEEGTFRILAANQAAVAKYGYAAEELLDMTLADLRWPEDSAQFTEITGAIAGEQSRRAFAGIRHRTREGRRVDVEIQVREVAFRGQRAWLTVVDDVTEGLQLQRELEHQAFHDSLTGLPNRALFHDRVEHVRRRLARGSTRYAVLMLDLDNFKTVNDSFGHGAGDELLLEVSRRLAGAVRPGDTAARLGGDEFGILLEDLDGETEAVCAAERLVTALRRPFVVAGRSLTLGATIGIALSGGASAVAIDVVRNADVALYAGKARGKDRHQLFSEEMHAAVLGRITLEQELREGVSRGEFALLYQPKLDGTSGRVVGVEALVRWHHPVRGLLAPDAFIAVAEEIGLIVDLDAWVLETACRQASEWARSASGPLPIAVNVSGRGLEGGGLLARVRQVLAVTGLDPRLLELELTESAAVQQEEETVSMLRAIRALGVRIAIDDFGTGYSILSRLQDFPIDTLKIDRSFISRITSLDVDSPIVSATVAMGRGLGLEVVAEGVETDEQRRFLVRQGCDRLQGYLASRPVEAALIPPMLLAPPLSPIEDPRYAALDSAVGVASPEPALAELVRGLLVELQRLTGLDSVHVTRLHWDRGEHEILFSRSSDTVPPVPDWLVLRWPGPLTADAVIDGPRSADHVPTDLPQCGAAAVPGRRTSVSVPVVLGDGSIFGTLCGTSERRVPLAQTGLEVMRIFASLIAAQIAAPARAR